MRLWSWREGRAKMKRTRKPIIAVIGAGTCSKELQDKAAIVGAYIAEHDGVLICGGLGGIMLGAARGASENGGATIGILPSENANDANEYIEYAIPTGFGDARNIMVVRSADAVVAFPGRYGTMSEIAFALQADKPVISVSASDWKLGNEVRHVNDPEEAARLAFELARASKK